MNKTILLSFDVEEFDFPKECGQFISEEDMFEISFRGLNKIIELLNKLNITATFFVTATFALRYPSIIRELSKKHEIACHGYSHWQKNPRIQKAKKVLEKITKKNISGYRAPRLKKPDFKQLKKLDFVYDSSINPVFLPPRYNNLNECRTYNFKSGIIEFPISSTPFLRFPLFWLSFKNLPLSVFIRLSKISILKDNYFNIFFHPWEFIDLSKFEIPFYVKKNSGKKMLNCLRKYLIWCKKNNFIFKTFSEFIKELKLS